MATEVGFDRPPGAHFDHREVVVKVWQIVDGEYVCHCGKDAVMEVRTQPDAEPGLVCAKHGLEWIDLATTLWRVPRPSSP